MMAKKRSLSKEATFDTLRNKRRRYAFHYLQQQDSQVPLSELSNRVAAWENETTTGDLDDEQRQRVYVSLLQTHLPKMDEKDIIDFDKENNLVQTSDNASRMEIYLDVVRGDDISWPKYYIGLTGFSTALMMLVWSGNTLFTAFSEIVWTVIVGLFLASAIIHHKYLGSRRLGGQGPPPNGA